MAGPFGGRSGPRLAGLVGVVGDPDTSQQRDWCVFGRPRADILALSERGGRKSRETRTSVRPPTCFAALGPDKGVWAASSFLRSEATSTPTGLVTLGRKSTRFLRFASAFASCSRASSSRPRSIRTSPRLHGWSASKARASTLPPGAGRPPAAGRASRGSAPGCRSGGPDARRFARPRRTTRRPRPIPPAHRVQGPHHVRGRPRPWGEGRAQRKGWHRRLWRRPAPRHRSRPGARRAAPGLVAALGSLQGLRGGPVVVAIERDADRQGGGGPRRRSSGPSGPKAGPSARVSGPFGPGRSPVPSTPRPRSATPRLEPGS